MADTIQAPSSPTQAGIARGGTAITNLAVFLGWLFDCHNGGWHLVDPNHAQESVLALGIIVLWDWVQEIIRNRAANKITLPYIDADQKPSGT